MHTYMKRHNPDADGSSGNFGVGYYEPERKNWVELLTTDTEEQAISMVHYLNGGSIRKPGNYDGTPEFISKWPAGEGNGD